MTLKIVKESSTDVSATVQFFRISGMNSFQVFQLRNARNGVFNTGGTDVLPASTTQTLNTATTANLVYELEIRAVLQGPLSKSQYQDIIEMEVAPTSCTP